MPLQIVERVVVLGTAELAAVGVVFGLGGRRGSWLGGGGVGGLRWRGVRVGIGIGIGCGGGSRGGSDDDGLGHVGMGGLRKELNVLSVRVLVVRG